MSGPAEAQFWREWADKAPAILRAEMPQKVAKSENTMRSYAFGGVGLGAVLGLAAFSKHVSKDMKTPLGVAAIGSAGIGLWTHCSQYDYANRVGNGVIKFADQLEKTPELREELALQLQKRVDADWMQKTHKSVEEEIKSRIHDYARDKIGAGGSISVYNYGWKPLQPGHLGAKNWEEVVSRPRSQQGSVAPVK